MKKSLANGIGRFVRRLAAATFVAALMAITPAAHAAEPQTIEAGTLVIGSDLVYPPYDYMENGEAKGFDADLMALIAPQLGLKLRFEDTRFASLISGLRAKRFDLIASALYITPERAEVIDYVPYATTGGSLVVRKDDAFSPKAPADLCGKRVGTLKGAAWVPGLKKVSDATCAANPMTIQEFATSAEAAQALLALGVDVEFDDAGVAKATVDASGGRLRITSDEILFPVVMGLGIAKGNDALVAALKQAFEKVKEDGQLAPLLTKYNLAEPSQEAIKAAFTAKSE
ncbi:transporter substrate-binding domain-containing protein [Mesorhizobium shangrilense]|uniref:Transporter substrate-binding domain-containing protein n=1 Tax=Mesorhizobium shangrilense TaxID=460060 RepID=A0ABV2D7S8_9HYPH